MGRTTRMNFTERQLSNLLGSVRSTIAEYEEGLQDVLSWKDPQEAREWYEEQLAILRPLERRLNRAGLRLMNLARKEAPV